jgi:hypothetical protein
MAQVITRPADEEGSVSETEREIRDYNDMLVRERLEALARELAEFAAMTAVVTHVVDPSRYQPLALAARQAASGLARDLERWSAAVA